MSDNRALGRSGEEAAVAYLQKKKFKVVSRGFRFQRGEIDIIAYDGDVLVFVEVKTRRSPDFGPPEESVTPLKQRQIRRLAEAYLMLNGLGDVPCRFDILSLFSDGRQGYRVHHITDAF
jgi:putative endonuclease